MKTVAQVVKEYQNRQNSQYESFLLEHKNGNCERFFSPTNIVQTIDHLEFDAKRILSSKHYIHIKTHANIIETIELLE